jgi:hypothetical protein
VFEFTVDVLGCESDSAVKSAVADLRSLSPDAHTVQPLAGAHRVHLSWCAGLLFIDTNANSYCTTVAWFPTCAGDIDKFSHAVRGLALSTPYTLCRRAARDVGARMRLCMYLSVYVPACMCA